MSRYTDSRSSRWNPGWDELPPMRRRFWLWLVLLLFLIAPGARIPLEFVGFSPFAATTAVLVAALLILVPLGRAAWLELSQQSAGGGETQPTISVLSVGGWALAAVILWGVFAVVAALFGPLIPTMPVIATVVTAQRWYQWRHPPV